MAKEKRGRAILYILVAAIVWVSASSGINSVVVSLNGGVGRAEKLAVSACSSRDFYNGHKSDCDALLTGQATAAAEGK